MKYIYIYIYNKLLPSRSMSFLIKKKNLKGVLSSLFFVFVNLFAFVLR